MDMLLDDRGFRDDAQDVAFPTDDAPRIGTTTKVEDADGGRPETEAGRGPSRGGARRRLEAGDARLIVPKVEGKKRRRKIAGDGHDFYPTQLWAVLGLLDCIEIPGPIWECACGDGEMSMALKMRGYEVISSDLVYRGYGEPCIDFMKYEPSRPFSTVFTNPPFKDAETFIRRARSFKGAFVCMFLPLSFLQGAGRASTLWAEDPPDQILVVPDRVTMYPRGDERKESGSHASAWYVWYGTDPRPGAEPPIGWVDPGAQHRYKDVTRKIRDVLVGRELARRALRPTSPEPA